jgi:positive phototaxis protein PixI
MERDKLNSISNDRLARSVAIGESAARTQQQFLRFLLQPHLMVLIELDARSQSTDGVEVRQQVTELVNIQIDRVVPMPHLPPAVMGVYNWRGEILWIVDLAMLVGVAKSTKRYLSLQPAIILTVAEDLDVSGSRLRTSQLAAAQETRQQRTIGLVVDEIAEIEWYELGLMRAPESEDGIDPQLLGWVRGVMESATGENFLVLDGQAIFARGDVHADV